MFGVKSIILTEALTGSFLAIVADAESSADREIFWVPRARVTIVSEESNGTLTASWTCEVLFADTDILSDILSRLIDYKVSKCSLAISMSMTLVVTEFFRYTNSIVEHWLVINLSHD